MEKRLAAILISDIVGYTKLMEEDTEGTVMAWSDARDNVIEPQVDAADGRLVKFMGDGFLAEFTTVQTALECAITIQNGVKDNSLKFRMAVHLGDIIDDGKDIYGEGINIASRLEGVAEPSGICISGDVYNQVRNRIPAEYENIGPQEVKNVSEPVLAYAVRFEKMSPAVEGSSDTKPSEKPSIAVLPFNNMSNDPNQEYFSDGITEDIITALSHLRWLNVIARNSSFSYKGQSPDIRKVSEELNCRYVLEGSIQKAGDRVRINAQLLEGATGNHIWAEKYDRELEDIFELQDEITRKVVIEIRPAIENVELQRILSTPPESLDAWDHYQKARSLNYKPSFQIAPFIDHLKKAVAADPSFIDAAALLINHEVVHHRLFNQTVDIETRHTEIQNLSVANPNNDIVMNAMGTVSMFGLGQCDRALEAYRSAVRINPTNMMAQRYVVQCLCYSGAGLESIDYLNEIKAINPKDPERFMLDIRLAEAYLCVGDYENAKIMGERSISNPMQSWPAFCALISALGHLGEVERVPEIIELLRKRVELMLGTNPTEIINLGYIKKAIPISDEDFLGRYVTGLQKADFPT